MSHLWLLLITKQIKLKSIDRLVLTFNKLKILIADKNIKNKQSYYDLCDIDERLIKDPDIFFKDQFTNWIDFLNIKREFYDFEICKNKINEYINNNSENPPVEASKSIAVLSSI